MLHGMDVMLAVVGQAESRPIVRPVTCLVLPIVYSYGCRTKVTVPHKDIIKLGASPIGYQCLVIHHTCVYSAITGSSAIDLKMLFFCSNGCVEQSF